MSKSRILVVEDEGIVALELVRSLGRLGYEVLGTAERGEEALVLALQLRPDLVLMDIWLKGEMDGIEAADAIRRQHGVPVVYLTAHSDPATLARAKLTGPFGYVLKPFDERDLATQIEMALYRHQADQQLRQQREWLRVTLTSIGDAVIATDGEGRITFVNPVAELLTGWKSEEAIGQPLQSVFQIINEQTGHPIADPVVRVLDEGCAVALANHAALVAKDGRTVPIEDSASPILDATEQVIGAVLVFHDVTDKRRAEETLQRSEERLRLAQQAARIGTFEWDMQTNTMVWTPELEALYGLPPGTFGGTYEAWAALVHPDDLPQAEIPFQGPEILAIPEAEWRVVLPDGSHRWLAGRGQVFRDETGKPVRMLGVNVDITARKQAEDELIAAKQSAEHAKAAAEQANRAKDHFLAVLSHELRTPLTPIVMGVSMLQDRPDLVPAARETLEMIDRNVQMEARLIDDLLDVSRIAQGKVELRKQHVELCSVIERAVEVCKPDIEARGLEFGVDLGPAAPYWVEADVSRLQQVFWNLLKNAIKFTPHGGCVGIRCRPNEKHVVAEVNDSGIGIESEVIPRIFNAFEQAEQCISRQFGGLGLGLAISKALVEMHGGLIEAHSEGRDKGTTFRVRLPLVLPPGQPSAATAEVIPRTRPLRILLVEDHGVTAKIMRRVLTAEGHAVEMAGDVATALDLADRHPFDLLLSDLGLPDGSGHDLMQQLRAHTFPGIALSGYGQEDDIQRSYQAGFAAHLTKPATREAVVATIAAVTSRES